MEDANTYKAKRMMFGVMFFIFYLKTSTHTVIINLIESEKSMCHFYIKCCLSDVVQPETKK